MNRSIVSIRVSIPRLLIIRALRERREGRVIKSSRGERAVFAVTRAILFYFRGNGMVVVDSYMGIETLNVVFHLV